MSEEYNSEKDKDLVVDNGGVTDEPMYALFKAGQSKRIWGELYKVIIIFSYNGYIYFLKSAYLNKKR